MFLQKFALMMAPQILMEDDFRQGLDLTKTWALTRFPPLSSPTTASRQRRISGLHVKAAGTNSLTMEPAFTKTSPGEADHVKWMADTQHLSSNSVPGFDAIPGQELRCILWARGRTFGTAAHPFGSAVTNPAQTCGSRLSP